jgi:hypothetical protein
VEHWNKRQQKQFVARLEKRIGAVIAKGLGRHLNDVHLTGLARMNRDPYVSLYAQGEITVVLQQVIDNAPEGEKEDIAARAITEFTLQFRDAMKPPHDDDTPGEWYRDAALSIWAAANETGGA